MEVSVKSTFTKCAPYWNRRTTQEIAESQTRNKIRLANFIQKNEEQIVSEWEAFALSLTPDAKDMTPLALRDHIHQILAFIVRDINSHQTRFEQMQKSRGKKGKDIAPSAAETHAALRLAGGFNIDQMVSEYRALRASIIKLWNTANTEMNNTDVMDLTRFNESIDQILAESVSHYTKKVNYSKDLFLGMLGHDLRNPLNAISMSSQLLMYAKILSDPKKREERQVILTTQIYNSTARITKIISDLIDVSRARFGSGLPVIREPMDMALIAKQLVEEMRIIYPARTINLGVLGDATGEWDKARMGQVFSNLIGNAIQYGAEDSPVTVTIKGAAEEVIVSVHNLGVPIPPEMIGTVFDSLTRAICDNGRNPEAAHLGLGLYITRDIIHSHGGNIAVSSTYEHGTTFTARLPRSAPVVTKPNGANEDDQKLYSYQPILV